jgi:hypothetical protein
MREEIDWKQLSHEELAQLLYENATYGSVMTAQARKNLHNCYSCMTLDELYDKVIGLYNGKLYRDVPTKRDKTPVIRERFVKPAKDIHIKRECDKTAQVWQDLDMQTALYKKDWVVSVVQVGPGILGVRLKNMSYIHACDKLCRSYNGKVIYG